MILNKSLFYLVIISVLSLSSCQGPEKNQQAGENSGQKSISRLDSLNQSILKDSTNAENYYKRAILNKQNKNVNSALGDINKAIQLDDKQSKYFVTLSDIYLDMGKISKCIQALDKAQQLDPQNNSAYLKQAKIYLILKEYQKSLSLVKSALELDKINPEAYFIRAYAFMETGDTVSAVRNFQVAADQNQQYYDAYIQLGILYSAKKDPVAINYFQTARNINPDRTEAYYLLGLYYQNNGEFDKAIETYHNLLNIDPNFKYADYNIAYIFLVDEQVFDSAIIYFSSAIKIDDKYIDAIFNRGFAYELSGEPAKAKEDYLKCLKIQTNYERAIDGLNRLDTTKQKN